MKEQILLFSIFFCGCNKNRSRINAKNELQKDKTYNVKNELKPKRFCPFCGAKLADLDSDIIFCPNCGSEL